LNTVYLVGGLRTPFARRGGALALTHPADLLGTLTRNSLQSIGVDPVDVDQSITGCVTKSGDQANNIGRTAWLTAGLPPETPGTTIDAKCGSSQQAVHFGAGLIASGVVDVVVANGVEHMTRHPLGQDIGDGEGDPLSSHYRDIYEVTTQGESAERIADYWKIGRSQCDELAAASQQRAANAIASGRFEIEIDPVGEFKTDSGPRESSVESLSHLRPVFRPDGVLTAGNSSQITDGASCVILASDKYITAHALKPLAVIEHQVLVGVDPVWKLTGPIPATRAILARAGLRISDIDRAEVNEAFASVVGAWLSETGFSHEYTNVNGGAIALGHPVGATGTRLILSAARELLLGGHRRILVTMCCGGGLGTGTVLKAVT
jgi:acetyl-CoA acetyltransferase family protein